MERKRNVLAEAKLMPGMTSKREDTMLSYVAATEIAEPIKAELLEACSAAGSQQYWAILGLSNAALSTTVADTALTYHCNQRALWVKGDASRMKTTRQLGYLQLHRARAERKQLRRRQSRRRPLGCGISDIA